MMDACSLLRFGIAAMLLCAAAQGLCAGQGVEQGNFDQQLAQRSQQYADSIRSRAAHFSPQLRAKIDLQTKRTIAKGFEILRRQYRAEQLAQFLSRHSGTHSPFGSFGFGSDNVEAVVVPQVSRNVKQQVSSTFSTDGVESVSYRSTQNDDFLTGFALIVRTVVQRK
jgi:hypothetical protein